MTFGGGPTPRAQDAGWASFRLLEKREEELDESKVMVDLPLDPACDGRTVGAGRGGERGQM